MHSILWKEIYSDLVRPIPEEAIQEKAVGAKTQGYKIGYLIERLNEILAPRGAYWEASIAPITVDGVAHDFLHETRKKDDKIFDSYCVRIVFTIFDKDDNVVVTTESFGGCNMINNSLGDTLKGAQTDGLKKALSYIGLGNEAFKGNIDEEIRQSSYRRSKALASILGKYMTGRDKPGKTEFLKFLCDAIETEYSNIDDVPTTMLEKLDRTYIVPTPTVSGAENPAEKPVSAPRTAGRRACATERKTDVRENPSTASPIRLDKPEQADPEPTF